MFLKIFAICVLSASGISAIAGGSIINEVAPITISDFNEKDLVDYKEPGGGEFLAYRLHWSRSFDDSMVFRIILKNGDKEPELTVKKYSATDRKLVITETYNISDNQMSNLMNFSRSADFWNRPETFGNIGLDGAEWKLEGVSNNEYHVTTRWSPLPPYYSGVLDPKTRKVIKKPGLSFEEQAKHSDEVGLDMFGLLIMLTYQKFDEKIY